MVLGSNTSGHLFDTTFTTNGPLYSAASGVVTSGAAGTSGQVYQSAGAGSAPGYSTSTFPATATGTGTLLRADGTNWVATTSTYPNTNAVNTLLYASSANVMSALATANSGVLTTDASGVPSIDTTNFVRQTTGMQVKGNNTNTAPPAGFIGEQITANLAVGSATGFTTNTPKTVTSINLTAGIWDISALGIFTATLTTNTTVEVVSISATTNVLGATPGVDAAYINTLAGIVTSGFSQVVPTLRVLLSGAATYYLVMQSTFTVSTKTGYGRITATRVG